MMINKDKGKDKSQVPKPNLIVTVGYEPKRKYSPAEEQVEEDMFLFIQSAATEYFGEWVDGKAKKSSKTHSMVIMFDKIKDGEDFYNMLSLTELKVSKQEI